MTTYFPILVQEHQSKVGGYTRLISKWYNTLVATIYSRSLGSHFFYKDLSILYNMRWFVV
jgi:hypothetical protein